MSLDTEANRITGVVTAIIVAAIPLAATYLGWTNTEADMWETLLLALVPVAVILGGMEFARSKVWSKATHEAEVSEALHKDPPA